MTQKYLPRENPQLYEINTAAWLFELSRKQGMPVHLGKVPLQEWDRLKDLGMDYVWLMGVWNRSLEGRRGILHDPGFHSLFDSILPGWTAKDVIGSSYSISSHEPDPLVGTWADLDRTREELHRRGMGLILDFIPNHTGIDHHWLKEHPDYFIQVSEQDYLKDKAAYFPIDYQGQTLYIAHGRDPNFPAWTDTAQLNYFNLHTRQAMIERLQKVARHCDGVRCDMAMLEMKEIFQRIWGWTNEGQVDLIPDEEFWTQAIREVPDMVYIAEAYWDTEWSLQQLGFDFVYDKRLYDRMKSGHPQDVYLHLTADIGFQKKLLRFIENHDEPRSITAFGRGKVEAAATLFSTLPGMKLFFQGQMEGRQIHQPLQTRQVKPEPIDTNIQVFYQKLLLVVNEDIFHSGIWQLKEVIPEIDNTAANIIAYTWKMGEQLRLVAVNLNQHPAQGRVNLQEAVSENQDYTLKELLTGQSNTQSGLRMVHPGLSLKLAGYQGQIWEI